MGGTGPGWKMTDPVRPPGGPPLKSERPLPPGPPLNPEPRPPLPSGLIESPLPLSPLPLPGELPRTLGP